MGAVDPCPLVIAVSAVLRRLRLPIRTTMLSLLSPSSHQPVIYPFYPIYPMPFLQDLRLLNADRNEQNMLIREGFMPAREALLLDAIKAVEAEEKEEARAEAAAAAAASGSSNGSASAPASAPADAPRRGGLANRLVTVRHLIPIDHGLALPDRISMGWADWVWLSWPQVRRPLHPKLRKALLAIDIDEHIGVLRAHMGPSLRPGCYTVLRIAHSILVTGISAGMTLADIGSMIARTDSGMTRPSKVERMLALARREAEEKVAAANEERRISREREREREWGRGRRSKEGDDYEDDGEAEHQHRNHHGPNGRVVALHKSRHHGHGHGYRHHQHGQSEASTSAGSSPAYGNDVNQQRQVHQYQQQPPFEHHHHQHQYAHNRFAFTVPSLAASASMPAYVNAAATAATSTIIDAATSNGVSPQHRLPAADSAAVVPFPLSGSGAQHSTSSNNRDSGASTLPLQSPLAAVSHATTAGNTTAALLRGQRQLLSDADGGDVGDGGDDGARGPSSSASFSFASSLTPAPTLRPGLQLTAVAPATDDGLVTPPVRNHDHHHHIHHQRRQEGSTDYSGQHTDESHAVVTPRQPSLAPVASAGHDIMLLLPTTATPATADASSAATPLMSMMSTPPPPAAPPIHDHDYSRSHTLLASSSSPVFQLFTPPRTASEGEAGSHADGGAGAAAAGGSPAGLPFGGFSDVGGVADGGIFTGQQHLQPGAVGQWPWPPQHGTSASSSAAAPPPAPRVSDAASTAPPPRPSSPPPPPSAPSSSSSSSSASLPLPPAYLAMVATAASMTAARHASAVRGRARARLRQVSGRDVCMALGLDHRLVDTREDGDDGYDGYDDTGGGSGGGGGVRLTGLQISLALAVSGDAAHQQPASATDVSKSTSSSSNHASTTTSSTADIDLPCDHTGSDIGSSGLYRVSRLLSSAAAASAGPSGTTAVGGRTTTPLLTGLPTPPPFSSTPVNATTTTTTSINTTNNANSHNPSSSSSSSSPSLLYPLGDLFDLSPHEVVHTVAVAVIFHGRIAVAAGTPLGQGVLLVTDAELLAAARAAVAAAMSSVVLGSGLEINDVVNGDGEDDEGSKALSTAASASAALTSGAVVPRLVNDLLATLQGKDEATAAAAAAAAAANVTAPEKRSADPSATASVALSSPTTLAGPASGSVTLAPPFSPAAAADTHAAIAAATITAPPLPPPALRSVSWYRHGDDNNDDGSGTGCGTAGSGGGGKASSPSTPAYRPSTPSHFVGTYLPVVRQQGSFFFPPSASASTSSSTHPFVHTGAGTNSQLHLNARVPFPALRRVASTLASTGSDGSASSSTTGTAFGGGGGGVGLGNSAAFSPSHHHHHHQQQQQQQQAQQLLLASQIGGGGIVDGTDSVDGASIATVIGTPTPSNAATPAAASATAPTAPGTPSSSQASMSRMPWLPKLNLPRVSSADLAHSGGRVDHAAAASPAAAATSGTGMAGMPGDSMAYPRPLLTGRSCGVGSPTTGPVGIHRQAPIQMIASPYRAMTLTGLRRVGTMTAAVHNFDADGAGAENIDGSRGGEGRQGGLGQAGVGRSTNDVVSSLTGLDSSGSSISSIIAGGALESVATTPGTTMLSSTSSASASAHVAAAAPVHGLQPYPSMYRADTTTTAAVDRDAQPSAATTVTVASTSPASSTSALRLRVPTHLHHHHHTIDQPAAGSPVPGTLLARSLATATSIAGHEDDDDSGNGTHASVAVSQASLARRAILRRQLVLRGGAPSAPAPAGSSGVVIGGGSAAANSSTNLLLPLLPPARLCVVVQQGQLVHDDDVAALQLEEGGHHDDHHHHHHHHHAGTAELLRHAMDGARVIGGRVGERMLTTARRGGRVKARAALASGGGAAAVAAEAPAAAAASAPPTGAHAATDIASLTTPPLAGPTVLSARNGGSSNEDDEDTHHGNDDTQSQGMDGDGSGSSTSGDDDDDDDDDNGDASATTNASALVLQVLVRDATAGDGHAAAAAGGAAAHTTSAKVISCQAWPSKPRQHPSTASAAAGTAAAAAPGGGANGLPSTMTRAASASGAPISRSSSGALVPPSLPPPRSGSFLRDGFAIGINVGGRDDEADAAAAGADAAAAVTWLSRGSSDNTATSTQGSDVDVDAEGRDDDAAGNMNGSDGRGGLDSLDWHESTDSGSGDALERSLANHNAFPVGGGHHSGRDEPAAGGQHQTAAAGPGSKRVGVASRPVTSPGAAAVPVLARAASYAFDLRDRSSSLSVLVGQGGGGAAGAVGGSGMGARNDTGTRTGTGTVGGMTSVSSSGSLGLGAAETGNGNNNATSGYADAEAVVGSTSINDRTFASAVSSDEDDEAAEAEEEGDDGDDTGGGERLRGGPSRRRQSMRDVTTGLGADAYGTSGHDALSLSHTPISMAISAVSRPGPDHVPRLSYAAAAARGGAASSSSGHLAAPALVGTGRMRRQASLILMPSTSVRERGGGAGAYGGIVSGGNVNGYIIHDGDHGLQSSGASFNLVPSTSTSTARQHGPGTRGGAAAADAGNANFSMKSSGVEVAATSSYHRGGDGGAGNDTKPLPPQDLTNIDVRVDHGHHQQLHNGTHHHHHHDRQHHHHHGPLRYADRERILLSSLQTWLDGYASAYRARKEREKGKGAVSSTGTA